MELNKILADGETERRGMPAREKPEDSMNADVLAQPGEPQLHLKTMSEPTATDSTQTAVANDALFVVAQIAAMCCIDLDSNLESAHKEYMAGEIPNGAFQHVLHRHTQMHAALHAAGFTERHPIFGCPALPKSSTNATAQTPPDSGTKNHG